MAGPQRMTLAIGGRVHQVRVLSDLSTSVVGALIDDVDERTASDPFSAALRRYREEGAPGLAFPWRGPVVADDAERAARVLRHLTRDLLGGVTTAADAAPAPTTETPPPANVRPIERSAAQVPALQMADDGTWRPSDAALIAQDLLDGRALRRSIPAVRSRYPRIPSGEHGVLPPAPKPSPK